METALFIIYILSFIFSIFAYTKFLVHMFQLNSYKPEVQTKWLIHNRSKVLKYSFGAIITFILSFKFVLAAITGIFINILVLQLNRQKAVKKPLVYTFRVKRLLATIFILMLIVIVISGLNFNNFISLILLPIYFILLPIIVLVANFMNRPIEKMIANKYINEAKKILKSMPNLKIIGITGSYGKTSVKFYLSKLLSAEFNVLHTPESYNTPMGVVKTIRENMKSYHEVFICEMGAKNIGDIKEICDIVHPHHGIITSIGPQHLESFLTVENVIQTKFELADAIPNEGLLFLNYDNEYIREQKNYSNIISYGIDQEYDPKYLAYDFSTSSKGSIFKMKDIDHNEYEFNTKLIGKHNIENIAAAIATANSLGIPMRKLVMQVKQLEGVEHRLQLRKHKNLTIIDDCYNSNPSGAKAALDTLNQFEGIKILLTPGMIELGTKQYDYNKEFGEVAAGICDYVILVGEQQTKPIYDGLLEKSYSIEKIFVVSNLQEALKAVDGIHSMGLEKIVLMENDLPDNYN